MKVYVIVKILDEGEYDNIPSPEIQVFSSLDAAKKAMKEDINKVAKKREFDYDTLEEDDTSFYCSINEVTSYGFIPNLSLQIIETEVK